MTIAAYLALRARLIAERYGSEIQWAQNIQPVSCADDLWSEFAWVVLNSGMREQVARGIWERVRPCVLAGGSAHDVFRHKGKAAAIDRGWKERLPWFLAFKSLTTDPARLEYCRELPWIGDITKFHLAKNLGVDCAKPDRHLVRIAGAEGTHELCARLSRETGDRIATVDLVIWRAANLGWV